MLRAGRSEFLRAVTRSTRHAPCLGLCLRSLPRTPTHTQRAGFGTSGFRKADGQQATSDAQKVKVVTGKDDSWLIGRRDENIPLKSVRLVDPTDGTLLPLQPFSQILEAYRGDKQKRKTTSIVLVATRPEPVVKVVNTADEYKRLKEQRKKRKATGKPGDKEIQLTWDVSGSDLQRKLEHAREGLLAGHRVSLVHAPKKGVRHVLPRPEMAERAQAMVDALADVGKEWKAKEVGPKITVTYLESLFSAQSTAPVKEVLIHLGSESHIVKEQIAAVKKELEVGRRVKVHFEAERERKGKNGESASTTTSALGSVAQMLTGSRPTDPAELRAKSRSSRGWSRKNKDDFVETVLPQLISGKVKEWKARDDWTSTTTVYLERATDSDS
ncbi:hypothetical protein EIP91_006297 [Steccherinum ochraceum]|uniref:Altered inheritance of mitochondria protein 23, mitochondrial n=1 Tax=Steccherinum ochraceum TaxID=92696 RepID=A0A4R0RME2_9APHY|nr:hypothetical protein EIP91_006297 [Steccherinum ochraceum]